MALVEIKQKSNNNIILESSISLTDTTEKISNAFDYEFTGKIKTEVEVPKFPTEFQIGLIVGASGSVKSTLLSYFGEEEYITWNNYYCIADNFENYDDAANRLGAVGLNSIPAWLQPYNTLSNGQKFRADMARRLKDNAVIDEFTSVVNRECAISCSNSIQKYIRNNNLHNIVFCSCHYDIIEYLQPDWIYNTDTKELSVGRSARQKPEIVLKVSQCVKQIWSMFAKHHYLSSELNKSADCYLISWNDKIVAFASILPMPGRFGSDTRLCVSEHRIVVLPDYQGLGIGNKISEYFGELYLSQGYRYFGKTANPRMGEHRERSELWKATATNLKKPIQLKDVSEQALKRLRPLGRNKSQKSVEMTLTRLCYSHEYIGNENTIIGENRLHKNYNKKLFNIKKEVH